MLPSPTCPLAGQSIFGQNVVCGSMALLLSASSTESVPRSAHLFKFLPSPPFSVPLPRGGTEARTSQLLPSTFLLPQKRGEALDEHSGRNRLAKVIARTSLANAYW